MSATPEWVHEPQTADLLHIKPSTLRNMRRERRLDAGTHWVYATGSIGGPVVYCIPAIRKMQRQRTIEAQGESINAVFVQLPNPVTEELSATVTAVKLFCHQSR